MDEICFEKIVNDIEVSFSMENLKLSDKTVSEMKTIYVNNKNFKGKALSKQRRRIVRYEF